MNQRSGMAAKSEKRKAKSEERRAGPSASLGMTQLPARGSVTSAADQLRVRRISWERFGSVEADVLEIERLAVNPFYWGSDPVGEFAEFGDSAAHKGLHVSIILRAGEPLEFVGLPLFFGEDFARGADEMPRKIANFAMKAFVRQRQAEGNPGFVDHALPAIDSGLNFFDVIVAQAFI